MISYDLWLENVTRLAVMSDSKAYSYYMALKTERFNIVTDILKSVLLENHELTKNLYKDEETTEYKSLLYNNTPPSAFKQTFSQAEVDLVESKLYDIAKFNKTVLLNKLNILAEFSYKSLSSKTQFIEEGVYAVLHRLPTSVTTAMSYFVFIEFVKNIIPFVQSKTLLSRLNRFISVIQTSKIDHLKVFEDQFIYEKNKRNSKLFIDNISVNTYDELLDFCEILQNSGYTELGKALSVV